MSRRTISFFKIPLKFAALAHKIKGIYSQFMLFTYNSIMFMDIFQDLAITSSIESVHEF